MTGAIVLPEVLLVAATLLAGWAALWPVRRDLGPVGYHLAALPAGLLAWVFAAGVAVVTGWRYLPGAALTGAVLFAGAVWLAAGPTRGDGARSGSPAVGAGSFAAAAAVYATLTALFAASRLTVFTADSVNDYWPMAVLLEREGEFTAFMISERSFLQVSAGAMKAALGGEWLFALYPLLAAVLVTSLVWVLWTTAPRTLSRTARIAVSGLPALFLLTEPSFLFYSLYVHAHMPSALYLLLALAGLRLAVDPPHGRATGGARGWLVVSGLSTAGLALTRPDGLAYAFVPIAVALALLLDGRRGANDSAAFFGPLLLTVLGAYAGAYATLGMWEADKLDGRTTAAILAVMVASAAVPWLVRRTGVGERLGLDRDRVLLGETLALAAIVLAAFALRWDAMSLAARNLAANLFATGGYGPLWYLVVAALLATVVAGYALRRDTWGRALFLSIVLFAFTASLVHGTGHVGRLGWGDSANRVLFHVVPVIVYYVAEVCAHILARDNRSTERSAS